MWQAIRRIRADIMTPSQGESGYVWAVIALSHVMLGAAAQGVIGFAPSPLTIMSVIAAYWVIKEISDLWRGGSFRDGLTDAALVGFGSLYQGPRWWPLAIFAAICVGAILKERQND